MGKEFYIIRHGETALNKNGIVQGRGINSDLNDTGREQAAAFYARYKTLPFDMIYVSDLKRTHQTVQQFTDAGIPTTQLSGLDELAWGEWEGKSRSDDSILVFRDLLEQWTAGNYDSKLKGGESPNEVAIRLQEALDEMLSHREEKLVLVCMHGRAMRLLLCMLSGKPFAEMADFPHQNTTLYRVSVSGDQFTITDFNNTDHLKVEAS
jgi:broad specificity phosphatase PhoE